MRIEKGVTRPEAVTIDVDGEAMPAYPGESVAAALLAGGRRAFRVTEAGLPRGPFCNMGVCFDCLVEVDGRRLRACMTAVRPGMRVRTGADAKR
jgi:predicted molibdopterin-dependent oxidoreductase YjgC